MFKAVIFDMDGVLIDSEPIHENVNFELFSEYGINNISREEYRDRFIGASNPQMWKFLKERYLLSKAIEEIMQIQLKRNIEHILNNSIEPMDGARELLELLRQENKAIGLASSSPLALIEAVVDKFEIRYYFNAIVSAETLKTSKPDPQIFLKTAELLGVIPTQCLVVEDSTRGVEAAKSAKMKCIALHNPNSGRQDISKADLIVTTLKDINIDIINNLFAIDLQITKNLR